MIHSSSGPKGGYSLSSNWEDIDRYYNMLLKEKHHCLNAVYIKESGCFN